MACVWSISSWRTTTSVDPAAGMAEIGFYHLTRNTLEQALPRLLEKTLQSGKRAVVIVGSAERAETLASLLWTADPDSFLPHGTARDGFPERQPIWLTERDENPNGAQFLFLADRGRTEKLADYERCFELFDGRDEEAVQEARSRWKAYGAAGHTVKYWQQDERGAWQQKA
jgi:DNA polymerase-3 subunit chi